MSLLRRVLEIRDVSVGADRGDEDGRTHRDRGDEAVGAVSRGVQHAHRMRGVGLEKDRVRQDGHREAAPPPEEETIAQDRRALVVLVGQLRHERRARDLVDRDEDPHEHGHDEEVGEQRFVREPDGRVPEEPVCDGRGHGRGVQKRVATSPGRVQVIREIADHGVEDRIDQQRQHDAEPDPRLRQPEHLVVVEEEKEREAVVLHAERHGSQAVQHLGPRAEAGRALAHGAQG